ncbi:hypothetical protein B0H13DRAFT_1141228 [Mycena leptocephala]|nr:hypothetical protein B0H13DRAFT_1141228 [Mycena leptocephala]
MTTTTRTIMRMGMGRRRWRSACRAFRLWLWLSQQRRRRQRQRQRGLPRVLHQRRERRPTRRGLREGPRSGLGDERHDDVGAPAERGCRESHCGRAEGGGGGGADARRHRRAGLLHGGKSYLENNGFSLGDTAHRERGHGADHAHGRSQSREDVYGNGRRAEEEDEEERRKREWEAMQRGERDTGVGKPGRLVPPLQTQTKKTSPSRRCRRALRRREARQRGRPHASTDTTHAGTDTAIARTDADADTNTLAPLAASAPHGQRDRDVRGRGVRRGGGRRVRVRVRVPRPGRAPRGGGEPERRRGRVRERLWEPERGACGVRVWREQRAGEQGAGPAGGGGGRGRGRGGDAGPEAARRTGPRSWCGVDPPDVDHPTLVARGALAGAAHRARPLGDAADAAQRYAGWVAAAVAPLEEFIDEPVDPREFYGELQEIAEGESGSVYAAALIPDAPIHKLKLPPLVKARDADEISKGRACWWRLRASRCCLGAARSLWMCGGSWGCCRA